LFEIVLPSFVNVLINVPDKEEKEFSSQGDAIFFIITLFCQSQANPKFILSPSFIASSNTVFAPLGISARRCVQNIPPVGISARRCVQNIPL
jgi:hypothetical protein